MKGGMFSEGKDMPLLLITAKSCLSLCVPMKCSLVGPFLCPWDFPSKNTGVGCHFLVHGISQVRTLEWVAISFSGVYSQPRDQTCVSWIDSGFFTTEPAGNLRDTLRVVIMGNVTAKSCVDSRYSLLSRDPSAFHGKGNENEDHEAFLYTAKSSTYEPSSCKLSKTQM